MRDQWPSAWGSSGKLVITISKDIVSEDGVHYAQTLKEGSPLASLGFHWESDISVVDGVATCAALSGLVNTDTATPANVALYNVYVYDSRGTKRQKLNATPFHIHESLNSNASTFTWEQWVIANQFTQSYRQTVFIGDRATVQAMIDAVLTRLFPLAQGRVTLVGGTATVSTSLVESNSNVHLTGQDDNVSGNLRVSSITPTTSFVITSSNPADSGVVSWVLYEA